MAMTTGPLTNLTVVDLTRLLPGSYCTWLLASLGATVIKIERPNDGDYMRDMEPLCGGTNILWTVLNRGKKSVALDLKDPEHQALLKRLVVKRADIVIESFRPGVMSRLGIPFSSLLEIKPELVCVSISGFGSNGPLASLASHDLNYLALSGLLDTMTDREDRPIMPTIPLADLVGGGLIPAFAAISLTLRARATGKGGIVDASILDGLALLPEFSLVRALAQERCDIDGSDLLEEERPYYRLYALRDGFVAVAAIEPKFWARLCNILGLHEYVDKQHEPSQANEIKERLVNAFGRLSLQDVEEMFGSADCCVTPVYSREEMALSLNASERRYWDRSMLDPMPVLGSPFLVDGERLFRDEPAPRNGEDSESIRAQLEGP